MLLMTKPHQQALLVLLTEKKQKLKEALGTAMFQNVQYVLHANMFVWFTVPMSRKGLLEGLRAPAQGPPCHPCNSITPLNPLWPDGLMLDT